MASKNINQLVKGNQRYLWGLILTVAAIGGGAVYGLNHFINPNQEESPQFEEEEKPIEPDLTGAISNTFEGKVSGQVITVAQAESKENREALRQVLDKLEAMDGRLTEMDKEREEFRKKLEDFKQGQNELFEQVNDVKENPAMYSEPVIDNSQSGQTADRKKMNQSVNAPGANYQQKRRCDFFIRTIYA